MVYNLLQALIIEVVLLFNPLPMAG